MFLLLLLSDFEMLNSMMACFIPPVHFSSSLPPLLRSTSPISRASASRFALASSPVSKRKRTYSTMSVQPPMPDDTAVDMLTFALSGPGVIAFAALFSIGGFLLISFAEIGNINNNTSIYNEDGKGGRRRGRGRSGPFYLRVCMETRRAIEFPDGIVRTLNPGESILRFDSREMCEAVARPLREQQDVQYTLYRLDGIAVRTLSTWPREINAPGAKWPAEDSRKTEKDLDFLWDEYSRVGQLGKLEKNWKDFINQLGGVVIDNSNAPCKLCNGTGYRRCFRCGGVTVIGNATFTCDCQNGRRPCEWCSSA